MKEQMLDSQGTPEQIKEAKKMLDKKQEKMSNMREADFAGLSEEMLQNLMQGEYKLELRGGGEEDLDAHHPSRGNYKRQNTTQLIGKIGSREINIKVQPRDNIYAGSLDDKSTVDGTPYYMIPGGKEIFADIFNKYLKIAKLQNDEIYAQNAQKQIWREDSEQKKREYMQSDEYKQQENKRLEKEQAQKEKDQIRKQKEREAKEKFKDIL